MPPAIPADLAPELIAIHNAPEVWWVSQIVKYIMRPHPNQAERLKELEERYKIGPDREDPVVGVHIRRSDKVTDLEAQFYPAEEYMRYVSKTKALSISNYRTQSFCSEELIIKNTRTYGPSALQRSLQLRGIPFKILL